MKKQDEHSLEPLRGLLKLWHELGYHGVSDEVAELVDSWTLKGPVRGAAVKRMDPIEGPLTNVELQIFNEAVPQAYEHNQISLSTLAYALLLSHTGRRPIQLTLIRIGDIYSGAIPTGGGAYVIRIPRAKQRGRGYWFRTQKIICYYGKSAPGIASTGQRCDSTVVFPY